MKLDSQISMTCNNLSSGKFSDLYKARYCAQEDINLIVCKDGIIKVLEPPLNLRNFTSGKPVCTLLKTNRDSKLVVSGSNFYLFDESERKSSFVKYSKSDKNLKVFPPILDERSRFCVFSFMQKIVVIDGCKNKETVSSCMAYNIKTNKWASIASMNESRDDTSCTVFKGKLVVTGGYNSKGFNRFLKSVEAYCFHENKWTQLPDMLQKRSDHGTVSIGNKMFVISRYLSNSCEVFDSITNKFTFLKTNPHVKNIDFYSLKTFAITVGFKIYVFIDKEPLGLQRRMIT